jgi:Ca-activated chloride channel family protein
MKHTLALTFSTLVLFSCGAHQPDAQINSESRSQQPLVSEEKESDLATTISVSQPAPKVKLQANKTQGLTASAELMVLEDASFAIIADPYYPTEENRENYAETKISAIKQVLTNPVSTFSTDVDTASYTNARRFLTGGQLPPADAIRVEEFVNYFDYQLPSPKALDNPIAMQTELMQTPWNEHTQLLRVSLQAYRSNFEDLPPLNLVFLLDVSGSMNSPDKLQLMQRSFNLLVNQLREQDRVSIAVYAGASGVVLEPTSGDNKAIILNAINQLQAGGSTHGSAGIHLAYQLAEENFDPEGINRVILGTDGDFNVGTTGIDSLKTLIEEKRESGVMLNVLGFGTGNYNDYMMEEISNHGNGVAYYIDSYQEARKIFSEQLPSTLQTVAKDVKIQVEFNPTQVAEYRLIGYDNRLLNREDFNNDKIDAGEMGSGHSVTALYEIVLADSEFRFSDPLRYQAEQQETNIQSDELAFVKVRYKLPESSVSTLIDIPVSHQPNKKASDAMLLSTAVAGFAEVLRNSTYVNELSIKELESLLKPTLKQDRWGYRQELLQLMKNAQALSQ